MKHDIPAQARFDRFPTSHGELLAAVDDRGALVFLDLAPEPGDDDVARKLRSLGFAATRVRGVADGVAAQVRQYLAGARRDFDLPLAPRGTPFQRRVWDRLRRIPYGVTVTYGELARRAGVPGGARAVGQANGANPIPVVVPCHRVVAAGGLGGYSGGLDCKRALLSLEGALPRPLDP
jgi:methylated-DNA-[protein]-cysteine S-methyltransferase